MQQKNLTKNNDKTTACIFLQSFSLEKTKAILLKFYYNFQITQN